MNRNLFLWPLGAAFLAAGCTMAPKYHQPAAPVPGQWPSGSAYEASAISTGAADVSRLGWNQFFLDENLRQAIRLALTNNLDLRLATLNVDRARALYGIQRADLLPKLDATGRGSKQRVPADLSSSGERSTVERYDANLGVASWEIDFFGRIRSLKDRALEEYLGSEQARRGAQLSLVAAVAQAYLTLAADRENLRLAETTLEAQRNTYALIKARRDLGLVPELNLHQAQTQVDAARTEVAQFTRLVAQDQNALTLLLGCPVPVELLPGDLGKTSVVKPVEAGLPAEVLLRRPDILQAEHLLKAANADIGAARAAFFPRISLTATFGSASSDLSGLFKAGSGAWSYAPQIVMPIFDARTWSAHRAAKVQGEIALTQFQQAIQSAFRDVADTLALRGTVDEQVAAQESLVGAVAETFRLATFRYDKGIDSYLPVLDAQRSLYAARQGLISLRLAKLTSEVRLYTVLGGGAQEDSPAPKRAGANSPAAHP